MTSDREYTIAKAIHQWHEEDILHYGPRSDVDGPRFRRASSGVDRDAEQASGFGQDALPGGRAALAQQRGLRSP